MDNEKVYSIRHHEVFEAWFNKLEKRDSVAYAWVDRRLRQIEEKGLLGDCWCVGDGVWELRFHYKAGFRIYYIWHGLEIIILLCGGIKASQERDIELAKQLAKEKCDA